MKVHVDVNVCRAINLQKSQNSIKELLESNVVTITADFLNASEIIYGVRYISSAFLMASEYFCHHKFVSNMSKFNTPTLIRGFDICT